jgi:signal transduction histidine kinase
VTVGGALLLAIAAIGAAYAGLVINAAPRRRDNLVFGTLAGCDALMIAWRGFNVLAGEPLTGTAVLLPCSVGTIVLALLTFEFLAAFPRRTPMRWRWRAAALAWGAATIAIVFGVERSETWPQMAAELVFYGPATLLIFMLGARAWRHTKDRDARTVIAMLDFRWAFGFSAYFIGPQVGQFSHALWAETTFAALVSFVVIGTAVMRTDLFALRTSASQALVIATLAFGVVAGGGATVWLVLATTAPGAVQQALLVVATLVPLGLAGLGWLLYPRLEKRVLAPLDDRRARRLDMQGEPLPAGPDAAIAEATRRIENIAEGAAVRWQMASALPATLIARLREADFLLPAELTDLAELAACLVVPARGASGHVVGAFLLANNPHAVLDRDTALVARDLAARVALAVERDEAVAALEHARRLAELGQFAAAVAHDIRTPLTSITLNIQILQRKLARSGSAGPRSAAEGSIALADDDREHLDIALEELHRLDRSVAEILDFAKPVRLDTSAIDVNDLVANAATSLTPILSGKGVALRCEPAATLPSVHGDAQRLRQVLVNLVDNAADASPAGGEVTLRARADDASHVAIEVEDRGNGIKADDLPRIFEPFFTTRPDGTGLGLAICQKVVKAHGGELRVRSSEGQGTTFTVVLPTA